MQGHVTILGFTPNIEAMIASGGRISTMNGTADEIFETSLAAGREKNEKLIGKVLSSGHTSVLEHGFVNLAFENVSVLAEQFLIEFRLASFTVKSRRYVDFSKAGYVSPELEHDAQREIFDETVRTLFAIGMNDMPGSGDNGLLTVQEQQAAQEVSGAYLGMTPQESAALGQLDELKALSGAKGRIILSYAVADDTGRTLREGEAVQAIRRLFPNMPVYGGLAQEERVEMLCAKASALEALAVELSETADGRRELGRQYASAAAVLGRKRARGSCSM